MGHTFLIYILAKKADAGKALETLVIELSVNEELTVNGSK